MTKKMGFLGAAVLVAAGLLALLSPVVRARAVGTWEFLTLTLNSDQSLVVAGAETHTGTESHSGTVTISGSLINSGLLQKTTTQLASLTPDTTGQLVWNTTRAEIDVSSGIGAGAWVRIATPTVAGYP